MMILRLRYKEIYSLSCPALQGEKRGRGAEAGSLMALMAISQGDSIVWQLPAVTKGAGHSEEEGPESASQLYSLGIYISKMICDNRCFNIIPLENVIYEIIDWNLLYSRCCSFINIISFNSVNPKR